MTTQLESVICLYEKDQLIAVVHKHKDRHNVFYDTKETDFEGLKRLLERSRPVADE